MKIGNIITAYRSGYHVVTNIQQRFVGESDARYFPQLHVGDERPGIITYHQIAREDFTPVTNPRTFTCDAGYCHVVTPDELEAIIIRVDTFGYDLIQQVTQANIGTTRERLMYWCPVADDHVCRSDVCVGAVCARVR